METVKLTRLRLNSETLWISDPVYCLNHITVTTDEELWDMVVSEPVKQFSFDKYGIFGVASTMKEGDYLIKHFMNDGRCHKIEISVINQKKGGKMAMDVQWVHEWKKVLLAGNVPELIESHVRAKALMDDPDLRVNEDYVICIEENTEPTIRWDDEAGKVYLGGRCDNVTAQSIVTCNELYDDYWCCELPEEEKDGYLICIKPFDGGDKSHIGAAEKAPKTADVNA